MNGAEAIDWHNLLPASLRESAYHSGTEMAWPREMALEVIALLEQHQQHILGVETWIPKQHGPTPTTYDWDESTYSDIPDFPRTPSDFVRTFSWEKAGLEHITLQPHFNFTVA